MRIMAGRPFTLTKREIEERMASVRPKAVKTHFVWVESRRFPVTQVIAESTGLAKVDFTSHHAVEILRSLGFLCGRVDDDAHTRLTTSFEQQHVYPHPLDEPSASEDPHAGTEPNPHVSVEQLLDQIAQLQREYDVVHQSYYALSLRVAKLESELAKII